LGRHGRDVRFIFYGLAGARPQKDTAAIPGAVWFHREIPVLNLIFSTFAWPQKNFLCHASRDLPKTSSFHFLVCSSSSSSSSSFALPQKKQKGSRHIEFAKNQCQKPKRKNSPAAQTAFRSLRFLALIFLTQIL